MHTSKKDERFRAFPIPSRACLEGNWRDLGTLSTDRAIDHLAQKSVFDAEGDGQTTRHQPGYPKSVRVWKPQPRGPKHH